ncbi:MAG: DinB family protein [Chloroflexota bacterium]|nr:DinB family protein [Chloroflexota bacterium]MDE2968929.1 DinB family protein [Chloroflexota bacterium]
MNAIDFVEMAATQSRNATLALVSNLERDQLTWRAGPEANPVGFLIWHVFRTEDRYVRMLTGEEETYTADGWSAKWPLPGTITGDRAALTTGNSWTSDEVGAFNVPPLDELLAYGETVRSRAMDMVRGIDPDTLEDVPNQERPEWVKATYLRSMITHEFGHQQQMDYIIGLQKAAGA